MPGNRLPAIVVLGQVLVVHLTHQTDVMQAVVTAEAVRVPVMELEPITGRASSALLVHEAASAPIALVHSASHRGRNVARGGRGAGLRQTLPRAARPGEAPGFEPFELLGDGLLDDRGQIAVGHL